MKAKSKVLGLALVASIAVIGMSSCGSTAAGAASPVKDATNVEKFDVNGYEVTVFDLNHDGVDLICTMGRQSVGQQFSCVKK